MCSYGNYAYNGTRGWGCSSSDSTFVAFARINTLVKTVINNDPINLYSNGWGTNYVSDNYLLGNTKITFIVPKEGQGQLAIFNLKGQKVSTLYKGVFNKGYHSYMWDGKNSQNSSVSSGIYFVKIEVAGKSQSHKIVLMK